VALVATRVRGRAGYRPLTPAPHRLDLPPRALASAAERRIGSERIVTREPSCWRGSAAIATPWPR
jgi:hypothetical protein